MNFWLACLMSYISEIKLFWIFHLWIRWQYCNSRCSTAACWLSCRFPSWSSSTGVIFTIQMITTEHLLIICLPYFYQQLILNAAASTSWHPQDLHVVWITMRTGSRCLTTSFPMCTCAHFHTCTSFHKKTYFWLHPFSFFKRRNLIFYHLWWLYFDMTPPK